MGPIDFSWKIPYPIPTYLVPACGVLKTVFNFEEKEKVCEKVEWHASRDTER